MENIIGLRGLDIEKANNPPTKRTYHFLREELLSRYHELSNRNLRYNLGKSKGQGSALVRSYLQRNPRSGQAIREFLPYERRIFPGSYE